MTRHLIHNCGAQGFNTALGDFCPACNYERRQREVNNPKVVAFAVDSLVPALQVENRPGLQPPDPKAQMAQAKLPILSVLSTSSIIHEAVALQFGAFEAPKKDGTFGYGPFNYREPSVEIMTYVDAALRHIFKYVDGEEYDPDTNNRAHHLGLAKATIGILLDAMEHESLIDNRPRVGRGVAAKLLQKLKR